MDKGGFMLKILGRKTEKRAENGFSLFALTWPLFIDLMLHTLTLALNLYLVGKVSLDTVAELTVGNQVFELSMIIFNFIGIGTCVVVAQMLGAGRPKDVSQVMHAGIGVNLIVALFVCLGILIFNSTILDIMQIPDALRHDSRNYLLIITLALLPEALLIVIASILRAYGFTKDSMKVSLLMNLVTVGGNLLLLFGFMGVPKMGVSGVAISTVIGRVIGLVVLFLIMIKRTGLHLKIKALFRHHAGVLRRMLGIGLPGAGENLAWHLQFMLCTSFVASMGEIPLATHGIYFQICIFILIFAQAIAMGTEIIIGHYVGALKLHKVYLRLLKSLKIGFVIAILISVGNAFVFGRPLLHIFTDNPEVEKLAMNLFLLSIIMEPGRIFNIIVINALRATGDAKFPMMMAIISMWGISVPLGYFLGIYMGMGLIGIWIAFCVDEWTRGLSMYFRWRSRIWELRLARSRKNQLWLRIHGLSKA